MLSFIPSILSRRLGTTTGSKLIIPMAAPRRWLHFPILIYLLMIWLFGELATINEINYRGLTGGNRGFLAWSILWTAGGTVAALDLLWQLWGRQFVTLDSDRLIYRCSLFGLSHRRQYFLNRIGHVRIAPQGNGRAIIFDYDDQTVRLGSDMNELDAQQIVTMIRKHINI